METDWDKQKVFQQNFPDSGSRVPEPLLEGQVMSHLPLPLNRPPV